VSTSTVPNAVETVVSTAGLYRLSVDQYHEMIRAGVLKHDDRVELLEGYLVLKMTKNSPHIVATELLQDALARLVPAGWYLSMQNPVTTSDSEPEPDAKVVRGQPRDYLNRRVGPKDTALVIEVADASLAEDRTTKKRIYARAAISTYWIVNLPERRVEVYGDPTGSSDRPDYRQHQDYRPGDQIPVVIDEREVGRISVDDLLP
jgi:Uma2 family endonuclease